MIAIALLSATMPFTAKAQDKVEASVGADFVSNSHLAWNRLRWCKYPTQHGSQLQRFITGCLGFGRHRQRKMLGKLTSHWVTIQAVSTYPLQITGSPITKRMADIREITFKYGAHSTIHIFEATLGYDFGPLALSWNTYFAGDDYTKENGDRAYSHVCRHQRTF